MDFAAELDALMGKNRNSAQGTKVATEHFSDSGVSIFNELLIYKIQH